MGLPEPPDNNETISSVNDINVVNETDSDDDGNEYDGYTLLPLGPEETFSDDDVTVEEEEHSENSLPSIIPMENQLVQEVWGNQATFVGIDIEMDNDKVNEVKRAMSNFTLPPTSIPAWANSVPEEMWKENLMDRLRNRNLEKS